jgi:hypothetical protein
VGSLLLLQLLLYADDLALLANIHSPNKHQLLGHAEGVCVLADVRDEDDLEEVNVVRKNVVFIW